MIYLDFHATTPLDPAVVEVMRPFLQAGETESFANPHARDYPSGRAMASMVEDARAELAASIGATPSEVLFTSGATESNNTAIKGVPGRHRLVIASEHACVLRAADAVGETTLLPVNSDGHLDPDAFVEALRPDTVLASVMLVNNEIGVIHPVAELARICRDRGVLFHCDAAQAMGRVPVRVRELGIDLLSLSGPKIYGPKGAGALYVRRGVGLRPLLDGGGQQRNIRSGTLAPMLCVGLARAATIADQSREADQNRTGLMRRQLLDALDQAGVAYAINGDMTKRVQDNLNLHFFDVSQERLIHQIGDKIAVSGSAACSSGSGASHVLRALGHDPTANSGHLRLSFGRTTREQDIPTVAEVLIQAVQSDSSTT